MKSSRGLSDLINVSSEEDRVIIKEEFYRQVEDYKQELTKQEPYQVARAWQEMVSRVAAKHLGDTKSSCSKGCGFCCHLEVTISNDEAELIAKATKLNNKEKQIIKRQAKAGNIENLKYNQRRCVFLDTDNSCQIYEFRPLACRNNLVVSPPADCDTLNNPNAQVQYINLASSEIMMNAAWEASGSGRMTELLNKLIK